MATGAADHDGTVLDMGRRQAQHIPTPTSVTRRPIDGPAARSYTQSRRNHSDIEDLPLTATTTATPTTPVPTTHRPAYHGSGAIAFSTKGEYGVRLMVQLGRHVGKGPASLAEIAAEEDLPRAYLEQLVVNLREAGLVTSTRGAHGGYELARPAETISMAEVLRALEGPIAPMMCASDDPEHATRVRSLVALHGQRPVGPRPRRGRRRARLDDARGSRPAPDPTAPSSRPPIQGA